MGATQSKESTEPTGDISGGANHPGPTSDGAHLSDPGFASEISSALLGVPESTSKIRVSTSSPVEKPTLTLVPSKSTSSTSVGPSPSFISSTVPLTTSSLVPTSSSPPTLSSSVSTIGSSSHSAETPTGVPGPPRHRSSLGRREVIGIALGITCLVALAVAYLMWRKRRTRRGVAAESTTTSTTDLVPHETADSPSRHRRQSSRGSEMHTAQPEEKILGSEAEAHHRPLRPNRRSARRRSVPASEESTSAMRERILMLTGQIREVEGHVRAASAVGEVDEPPPGYAA
ncbi:hypothetical protein C8R46DRAFT_1289591 [Mycena filopes]|nr:hypothetical protein C8R46DRAFT_1289591 [Mycena filopes]